MGFTYTYYGHSAHLIDTGEHHLLVDPYFSDNPSAPISHEQVPADYIFVSHGHNDHIGDTEAIVKRTGALIITNHEIAGWFSKKGYKTHGQHIGGGYQYPFGYLKLTIAFHGSIMPDGSYGGNPAGMLLTTNEGQKIYLACDTGLFGDMQLYGDEGIDLAVLPIGDNYTMGPDDALKAVELLRPKNVVPCHYNTFPLIKQDAHAWAKRVSQVTSSRVHVVQPGEHIKL